MSVRVRIPAHLRSVTQGQKTLTAEGFTVEDIINNIAQSYPGFEEKLYDGTGLLRRYINIYINGQWIESRAPGDISLAEGDELSIIFAISGG